MILALILLICAFDSVLAQRTYCQLPDPIFNDGVKNSTWGDADPSDWNYLNSNDWKSKVVTCGASFQSPINIVTTTATKESTFPAINYILKSSTKNYFEAQRDYTKELEGEYDFITAFDLSNSQYKYYARQFHIHTPSEHQVDGKNFDLEVHFVHQAVEDGEQSCNDIRNKLTVFGLLFQQSNTATDYEVFKPWFDDTVNRVTSFDMNDFFQRMTDKTYYHYTGSLTTIPCSQTVNWYVFTSPLPISKSQFKQFQDFLDNDDYFPNKANNRPTQNLNGRTLYKGTASFNGVTSLPVIEASWSSIIQMAMLLLVQLIITI
ncbi:unnamed protein product (macronuclear) [Paramecium tetraurelia]|uniref:Carbonic anhydrase n=1 Tax=Paramecium tetraurelia TaxID=5888 RepID=A0BQJ5_PARTE|nr:uncharacterized protein GSPATT00031041001 [Paramecium tetraurelia]CAK60812.1 unnamed protein product [Paramecium tetraurelia]|eukprot:XP_001428210.1 hypothetical protein (macronuclear) [Paramecium tetraurelia strain d4-2]